MSRGLVLVCLFALLGAPLVAERDSAATLAATMAEDGVTPVLEPIDVDLGEIAAAPSARVVLDHPEASGVVNAPTRPFAQAANPASPRAVPHPAPVRRRLAWLRTLLI